MDRGRIVPPTFLGSVFPARATRGHFSPMPPKPCSFSWGECGLVMDNKFTDDESSCPLPPLRRAGRDSAGKRSFCAFGRDFCVGGRFRAQKWRFKAKNVENLLKDDDFYEFLSFFAIQGQKNTNFSKNGPEPAPLPKILQILSILSKKCPGLPKRRYRPIFGSSKKFLSGTAQEAKLEGFFAPSASLARKQPG